MRQISRLRSGLLTLTFLSLASVVAAPNTVRADDEKPATESGDWEEYFKLGHDYFNGRMYDKAVEAFEACVRLKADYKEAWYNLGVAYGRQSRYRKEIDAYQKAVELDPRYEKALYNLAIAYEDAELLEDALATYERIEAVAPKALDALVNQGILRARLGQLPKAVQTYKRAIALDGAMADAWFNLGIAFGRMADRETDEAIRADLWSDEREAYMKTVELAPGYYKGWYNLGISENKLGNVVGEIAAYEKALENRERYPQALFNLAFAYEDASDNARALATWNRYVEVAGDLPTEHEFVAIARDNIQRLQP